VRSDEGHRLSEKRPRTLVSALLSIAAAKWSKNRHLRDYWRHSVFDFFDSIGPARPNAVGTTANAEHTFGR
jgi:hypothetical protein